MPLTVRQRRKSRVQSSGFSLPELLIVIVIAGLFSSLAISAGTAQWQREQINKVALELSGWLETVRRAALRGEACSVTIITGTLSGGSTLATATCRNPLVEESDAPPDPPPLLVENLGSRINLTVASSSEAQITFSPRGTRSGEDVTVTLTLNPSGKQRCVTISGLLAMINPGQVTETGTCQPNERF